MAVNKEVNIKLINLFRDLVKKGVVKDEKDFCDRIGWHVNSFFNVLSGGRSFPRNKIPVVVTLFNLPRNYFTETNYTGEENIHSKVRFIRTSLNINQTDFAHKLGVTQSAISAIEKGVNTPSFEVCWGLINTFKVNPYYLFSNSKVAFDTKQKFSNMAKRDSGLKEIERGLQYIKELSL